MTLLSFVELLYSKIWIGLIFESLIMFVFFCFFFMFNTVKLL